MNLFRTLFGMNKFVVIVKPSKMKEPPNFIHLETRTYHVKARKKVDAVEKAALQNYKRNEIVFYTFKTYTEKNIWF